MASPIRGLAIIMIRCSAGCVETTSPMAFAQRHDAILAGRIRIAPPDLHMLVHRRLWPAGYRRYHDWNAE